jgi:hypothetical protein
LFELIASIEKKWTDSVNWCRPIIPGGVDWPG